LLEHKLAQLKLNSKASYDEERNALERLEFRKAQALELLDASKKR
jgi:hypothetical protein